MEFVSHFPTGRVMVATAQLLNRELWRWYVLLFIANELDLVYTYFGLGRGSFLEANPWLAPHLLTWWPITLKVVCLAGLAVAVVAVLEAGLGRQQRMLGALRFTTAVYAGVLVLHIMNLLISLMRG